MLKNPSAKELMEVVAVAGLAQNFAALRSPRHSGWTYENAFKQHLEPV
jgi:hydroxymethylglutaryl-CoA reductase